MGCSKTDEFFEDSQPELKKAKTIVMPSAATDVLVKAEEDWNNINEALQNAGSGEVVQLGEGLFYLHKSIIRWDFNGTLSGSGMNETIIQTVPGELFDVSECPPMEWSLESNDGSHMFSFPHKYNNEVRTVTVSDLSILINEPATLHYNKKNTPNESESNSMHAINVHYENLDNDMANPIHLNVVYKNLSVTGEKDADKYLDQGYSIFTALAAYGASNGTFEAKNVHVETANGCIKPHAFFGEDASVTVKNTYLKSCRFGIYSFLNHSWTILNNEIKDGWRPVVMLKKNAWGVLIEGPEGHSSLKNNWIQSTGDLGFGIQFVSNVEVKNNIIKGSCSFGGIAGIYGNNWIIKDNDLCDLVPVSPNYCTIFLNNITNSEIKNNVNQLIGGPGAIEPTNIIGEGQECDE